MNNQEPISSREATLAEYVATLPASHIARTEYDELIDSLCDETAERIDLGIDLARAEALSTKYYVIAALSTIGFVVMLILWMLC